MKKHQVLPRFQHKSKDLDSNDSCYGLFSERINQVLGDAAQAEAPDTQRGAVVHIFNGLLRRGHNLRASKVMAETMHTIDSQ